MKSNLFLVFALATAPLTFPVAAFALPAMGDIVGTNPDDAKAALDKAGCPVDAFEAEDGKIEAKCTDTATGKGVEIYIDPKTGAVAEVKLGD
jgi:Peptidase propeptide and YPEB domain